jgi:hypothetical protein
MRLGRGASDSHLPIRHSLRYSVSVEMFTFFFGERKDGGDLSSLLNREFIDQADASAVRANPLSSS